MSSVPTFDEVRQDGEQFRADVSELVDEVMSKDDAELVALELIEVLAARVGASVAVRERVDFEDAYGRALTDDEWHTIRGSWEFTSGAWADRHALKDAISTFAEWPAP